MGTVLITGANRGIGLALARHYGADGWRVHATCRDPDAAEALNQGDVSAVHRLDVTDADQVEALAAAVDEPLDVVINNAGVAGPPGMELGKVDHEAWQRVMAVNVMGPLRVAEALAGHLARAERPRLVFMSSRAGSIADNLRGGRYVYRSSKAAMNMVARSVAMDLADRNIITVAVHPGWVRTDMGGSGAPFEAAEAASMLRTLFDRLEPHHNGHFLNYDGAELEW